MQTALKTDPSSYLHHKDFWKRHEMEQTIMRGDVQNQSCPVSNPSDLKASASSAPASDISSTFVTYGIEFSKQFVFFFSNTLSFLVALSFSQALTTTLKYYIGEQKLVEVTWLPWIVALLMLFVCVIVFALLSLWIKNIIGNAPVVVST